MENTVNIQSIVLLSGNTFYSEIKTIKPMRSMSHLITEFYVTCTFLHARPTKSLISKPLQASFSLAESFK